MRHGEIGADGRQQESDDEYWDGRDDHVLLGDIVQDAAVVPCCPIDASYDGGVGEERWDNAQPEALDEERPTYEAPLRAHKLHGVQHEAMVEDTQPDGVVDETQGDDDQQESYGEHKERGSVEVEVEALHQVFLVNHICYELRTLQLAGNPL